MRRAAAMIVLCVAATSWAAPPTSPKRPLPDYDGLADPPTTAGEVVAWVPRVIFFPVYLVAEYLLRRPLGFLIKTGEEGNWPSELLSFFTFGGEKDIGLVPTFYVDLGLSPTVGFYFFWNNALHPRHSMRARATAWSNGYNFSLADRWRVDDAGSRLQLSVSASRSPDLSFYGLGPRSLDEDKIYYDQDRTGGELSFDWRLGYGDHVRIATILADYTFRDAPMGVTDYKSITGRVEAGFDTRSPWPGNGTGIRAATLLDVGTADPGTWIRAAATVGAFWDVVGLSRVLGVALTGAVVEPTDGEVPFNDLVVVGGGPVMAGFRPRRLLGQSAIAASMRYEWPVWAALAGSLQVDVGNVFGPRFEDFDPELLRFSVAVALRSMGASDHELQFVIGVGTETFDQGAALTSIRFALGGTYGF